MISDQKIVEEFCAGRSIDSMAKDIYYSAKNDEREGKGEKLTHKQARAIVELAVYDYVMQQRG